MDLKSMQEKRSPDNEIQFYVYRDCCKILQAIILSSIDGYWCAYYNLP